MNLPPIDNYIITYSNRFEFNGRKLAFRKKLLFDITETPKLINKSDQGWWVNRQLLTIGRVKEIIINEPAEVNVSNLPWYVQIHIDECFNLAE